MLSATETSSHPAANMPLPRQSGGAKPMRRRRPSRRSQRAASAAPAVVNCSGEVTSISRISGSWGSLRAVRRVRLSARPAPDRTISAPSSWARRATAKASDASVRTPVIRSRLPSRSPTAPESVCECRGMHVGILGGTGPAGRGVAVRLGEAGVRVTIGSRDAERAVNVAGEVAQRWPGMDLPLDGADNADAAAADLVVLATPWDSAIATVRALREPLAGKVVVSMANALVKEGREMLALIPPRGSVAAAVQAALPDSLVAAAFHHLPAAEMEDLQSGLEADVLVCSDHPEATRATVGLVERMRGLRPLDAGSLSQAGAIEAFTAVCVTLNIRHKAHSTLRM